MNLWKVFVSFFQFSKTESQIIGSLIIFIIGFQVLKSSFTPVYVPPNIEMKDLLIIEENAREEINKSKDYYYTTYKQGDTFPKYSEYNEAQAFNKKSTSKININTAEIEDLLTLRGVGLYYATKIVERRILLGGFHSIDQLNFKRLIRPELYEKIKDQLSVSQEFNKIILDTATYQTLSKHYYISKSQAYLITKYTKNNENIDLDIIKQICKYDDESWNMVKPYLQVAYSKNSN